MLQRIVAFAAGPILLASVLAGGFVSCEGTTDYQPRANVCFGATSSAPASPVAQTLWEFTSTLQYKPIRSIATRLEYRYDKSNQNVFQFGGRATSYQPALSLGVIYTFLRRPMPAALFLAPA